MQQEGAVDGLQQTPVPFGAGVDFALPSFVASFVPEDASFAPSPDLTGDDVASSSSLHALTATSAERIPASVIATTGVRAVRFSKCID